MTTVKDLLDYKLQNVCRPVCTISSAATVLDAVHSMNRERIGGLVVVDTDADTKNAAPLAGIFTERDVLTRVVGEHRDPVTTLVGEVMTSKPVICSPQTPLDELRAIITRRRVRHLPVIEENRLVGIVTGGDVLAYDVNAQQRTIQHLHDYITG